MDSVGKDAPKAVHIVGFGKMAAERLADSAGIEQDRLELVADDVDSRYAVAYQAITDGHDHDDEYKLCNPFKKRYWVPLKIQNGNEEYWVLVDKTSLHKRFGLSYKEIDASAEKGKLGELVETIVNAIYNSLQKEDITHKDKFVKGDTHELDYERQPKKPELNDEKEWI